MRASVEKWKEAIKKILIATGMREDCCDALVETQVLTESRGVISHGIGLLGRYVNEICEGLYTMDPQIRIVRETPGTAVIDGDNALGAYIGVEATKIAIAKAKNVGSATVVVRNCNHYGAGLSYADMACKEGMMAWLYCNANPGMAPMGGTKAIVGTNPYTFGAPAGKYPSYILDMATSTVAFNKIMHYRSEGKQLPEGWIVDKNGKPSTDPNAILEGGSILPFGGLKGFALSTMVDLAGGLLSGASYTYDVNCVPAPGKPATIGFMINVVNIEALMDMDEYTRRMEDFIDTLHANPLAEGATRILYPGQMEGEREEKAAAEGIEVDKLTWESFSRAAKQTGFDPEELLAE